MNNEMTSSPELPEGWAWTRLGDIGEVNLGKTPRKTQYTNGGGLKIVKFRDIVGDNIYWDENDKGFVIDSESLIAQLSELHDGDVLVTASAHSSEHIGKKVVYVSTIPQRYSKVFFVGELLCIRVNEDGINPRIVYYYLLSQDGYRAIQDHVRGVHLIASEARQIPLPLPPLPEQHRIVAKIEELFTRLDAGVEALKRTKAQIKRYRQSVLKYAFEGKLTAEWRQAPRHELEPASILIERIKHERQKNAKGKYKELPPLDTSDLPELPEGWVWIRVGDITGLSSGRAFKKREYSDEGVRLFQIANVSFGAVVWDSIAYMPVCYLQKYPELALKAGDILMALNRPVLDGRLKIGELNEKDAPSILYQRVGRFDFYDSSIKPFFLYFSQTPFFIDRLKTSLQGVDQPFVTKPRLLRIPLPITSLAEQCKVIEEIERRFSIADQIEKTVDHSLKQAERLRQSILKRAFEGKLVAQDPNDEPAEKLLERIKAEKTERKGQAPRDKVKYSKARRWLK